MSEIGIPYENSFDAQRLRIDSHRHLIGQETRQQSGIMEYFDVQSGKRVLTIPVDSEQAEIHTTLVNRHVPVYPVLARDNQNLLLDVPNDARTVQSNLKFIARDVLGYKEIFSQVGEVLGRCALNGLGVPRHTDDRTILNGIAFSLNDAAVFGGNVHLLPPYIFDTDSTKTQEMHEIETELKQSPYISAAVARELTVATSMGWESVRAR